MEYKMSTLSVIVPIYKVEKYLNRCISSILSQDFSDFELILVDDGSPDKCGIICDEYALRDSRIKVIHKKNGGLSSARNAGIDIARGKYITFIDSDDYIHPNMFLAMISKMVEFDSDVSISSFIRTTKDDEFKELKNEYFPISSKDSIKAMCQNISFITAWGKIYKTELFENIRYPDGKYHEDEFTTYKLFYKSQKIIYTNDKLYCYYINEGSIIQGHFSEKHLDSLDAFSERIDFFETKNEAELVSISKNVLISRIMYCHQCIMREKTIKNKSELTKKALSYLDKSQKNDYLRPLPARQKIWAMLFFISPSLYSRTRNLLKIGL